MTSYLTGGTRRTSDSALKAPEKLLQLLKLLVALCLLLSLPFSHQSKLLALALHCFLFFVLALYCSLPEVFYLIISLPQLSLKSLDHQGLLFGLDFRVHASVLEFSLLLPQVPLQSLILFN